MVTPRVSKTLYTISGFVVSWRKDSVRARTCLFCLYVHSYTLFLDDVRTVCLLFSSYFLKKNSFWKLTKGTEWDQGPRAQTLLHSVWQLDYTF